MTIAEQLAQIKRGAEEILVEAELVLLPAADHAAQAAHEGVGTALVDVQRGQSNEKRLGESRIGFAPGAQASLP